MLCIILVAVCAACITVGCIMSYWNKPFFPASCRDAILDDAKTYDTTVRIAGSFTGIALSFKAIADHYGWTHVVLLTDDDTKHLCWYGGKHFEEVFGNQENYTFTWLMCGSQPTDKELDDLLQQVRSRTRGLLIVLLHFYRATKTR